MIRMFFCICKNLNIIWSIIYIVLKLYNFYGEKYKIKKNYTKKINDKEIKVLEFSNNLIYLTQVEDNKILCIDATYSDKSKDKILNSFDSISFNWKNWYI